ncbi:MAG: alpha/beta hydrolase domain-containing protein [Solirubrobacteraceae bacterium]
MFRRAKTPRRLVVASVMGVMACCGSPAVAFAAQTPATRSAQQAADKVDVEITRREVVANGQAFGAAGSYEKLVGTIAFQLDPEHPRNAAITDLDRAPRNEDGLVSYSTDFYLLRPTDTSRWNGKLVFEVNNRGTKPLNYFFNDGSSSNDPTTRQDFGTGFLLNEGFALAWAGWEGDVLPGGNRMTIRVPVPTNDDGSPITQRIVVEFHDRNFQPDGSTTTLPLGGSRGFASYPVAEGRDADAELRVRPSDSPRPSGPSIPYGTVVPRDEWEFSNPTEITLRRGFQPGMVYELSYVARDPRVMGLGYAATRDVVSFLRRARMDDDGDPNPVSRAGLVRHVLGVGISSSGMYMRDFLYQGFNEDLAGKRVFDGVHIHTAGAHKLFLNYRFSQPNPYSVQHRNRWMPYVSFPFNFGVRRNPLVERGAMRGPLVDGILKRRRSDPLVIQTDTSFEYWQFQASLVDTDGFGNDVPLPPNARHYLLSGTEHGSGIPSALGLCQQLSNPTSHGPALRALFTGLDRWVTDGVAPPPSQRPTIGDGLLARPSRAGVGFPRIPGVTFTSVHNAAGERDFGRGVTQNQGIISRWGHPRVIARYDVRVPRVDAVGIDEGGVEVPVVGVPTATLTGWNLRRAPYTAGDLCDLTGMSVPLPVTTAQADLTGDERPSLEELYGSHDGYVAATQRFANEMVDRRLLLPADAEQAVEDARAGTVLGPGH